MKNQEIIQIILLPNQQFLLLLQIQKINNNSKIRIKLINNQITNTFIKVMIKTYHLFVKIIIKCKVNILKIVISFGIKRNFFSYALEVFYANYILILIFTLILINNIR